MITFESNSVQRKILRGAILKLLSQGTPILIQTLEVVLRDIGENIERDMLPCVNYLLDRGYIRVWNSEEKDVPPMPDVLLCITANGQDVLDGTAKDPGIVIPCEGRR